LTQIANEIQAIMESPMYREMYPNRNNFAEEETDPVNDFWKDYLYSEERKTKYSSKKIITYAGGVVLFASIGSAITGFGAGIRNAKEFICPPPVMI
jgi:hypothetical protein